MHEPAVGHPWLEYYPTEGGPAEQVTLESFPFTIGRNEATDLQIQSTRVSRQHVVITQDGEQYRVKDLDSTNGTFLNGQRIREAPLSDGDLLVVADVEFGFFCGHSRFPRGAPTQVIEASSLDREGTGAATALISQTRQLHEMLMHRAIDVRFSPIVNLGDGSVLGYEACAGDTVGQQGAEFRRTLLATDCRLASRTRRLERLVAIEQARGLRGSVSLFVKVDATEIGADGLLESLDHLRHALADGHRLVVEIPEGAASTIPYACRFRERLHDLAIGIAYGVCGPGQFEGIGDAEVRPDFLRLPRSLVGGIDRNSRHRRQAEGMTQKWLAAGCEIIATGVRNQAEADACLALGCRYGQGAFLGPAKAVDFVDDEHRSDTEW